MPESSAQPELLGRYVLTHRLARGGMAEVWLAREEGIEGFQRVVCVKKILPDLNENPEFREMFIDEARIAARLNHANIVQTFDLGEEEGVYYIAMQFVLGENLGTIWKLCKKADRRMPPEIAAWVIAQAARGLHHAHTRKGADGNSLNIVHRDISPQNVMASYDGEVKVVDFGIAKAKDRLGATQEGIVKGKTRYMSPEQLRSRNLDGRTDIFSLGVTLWELVSGRKMLDGDSEGAILKQLINYQPIPVISVEPSIPEELNEIILKATAVEADDRYASGRDFQYALERFVHGQGNPVGDAEVAAFWRELGGDRLAAKEALAQAANRVQADLLGPERRKRKRSRSFLENEIPAADTEPGVEPEGDTTPETLDSSAPTVGSSPATAAIDEDKTHASFALPAGLVADRGQPSVEVPPPEPEAPTPADAVGPADPAEKAVPVEPEPPTDPSPEVGGGASNNRLMLIGGILMVGLAILIVVLLQRGNGDVDVTPLGTDETPTSVDTPKDPGVVAAKDIDSGVSPTASSTAAADVDAGTQDSGTVPDAGVVADTGVAPRTVTRRVRRRATGPGKVSVVVKYPAGDKGTSDLFIKGERVGSPPTVLELEPGRHVIELRARGRPPMRKTVTVQAAKTSGLLFDITKQVAKTGLVKVSAGHPGGGPLIGAKIRVDGIVRSETTPSTVRVLEGTHEIEVQMPGGGWRKKTVKVEAGHLVRAKL